MVTVEYISRLEAKAKKHFASMFFLHFIQRC